MKNRFQLSTPYESYRIVTSNYDFQIMPGYQYLLGLDLNYQNRTRWIKVRTNYHKEATLITFPCSCFVRLVFYTVLGSSFWLRLQNTCQMEKYKKRKCSTAIASVLRKMGFEPHLLCCNHKNY